jgi:transketolase
VSKQRPSSAADGDAARKAFDADAARVRCLAYRRRILDISQQVTALHMASAFSCTEIVDVIYNELMNWTGGGQSPDVFLMSKGHGCMIQYVILEEMGVLSSKDLDEYCKPGGQLGVHPHYGVPGIAAATGSLGHGMGIATGMAHAERVQGRAGQVYLVLGDGECQEGSTWEGAMMAANLGLDNLIAFVDMNDFTGMARMSEEHPAFHPLLEKFRSFGWEGAEVNGHGARQIQAAVRQRKGGKPFVVVAETVKGRGVSFMEHVPIWHYRAPDPQEYRRACEELVAVCE